ncbi:hypothetical protein GCK72_022767 [Caenorhabditis remanei]|uniref:Uncharacterized protein n=1 Tax=Caenorhabditis remanei TaxID=31234 RepID=A0A6A5FUU6_CAERE|nr:hypothetical protein GCK72_022767 [Caenorhabditis remanei]KAF1746314.1 hypothetical protein GCK72_022767 [Caenorhabditis remanei]
MDSFNSDCKLVIKMAGPEVDTKELDSLLKRVADVYSDAVAKDAKPSVDGFETMIEKMVKGGAEGSDYKRSALLNKNQQIDDRYKELLNSAVD